jgi:predicted site-specific integrase-resolvase
MQKYMIPLAIDISRPLAEQPANLTLPEAAAWLRRTTRTLGNWEARGLIRVVRPAGGNPIIPRSEIERLMREGA